MNALTRISFKLLVLSSLVSLSLAQQPAPTAEPQPTPAAATTKTQAAPDAQAGSQNPASQNQDKPAPTPSAQPTPPPEPEKSGEEQEKEIQKKEQSQRILGVVPQFGVTSREHPAPLTPGQKFHLFAKSSFDPFEYVAAGFQAGLSQAQNEFPGYGQGAEGYGKRFGAGLADQVSSNFFANFFYPVLLKEDPRYFRSGQGSIKRRIAYSLAQEFVTRTDSGHRRFNFSNVLGAFSSGGLSNLYYPSTDRGLSLTMSRSAISLAYGSVGGLIDEFWTDIDHKLFHKHSKDSLSDKDASANHDAPADKQL
jgi:hypothetical protein